MSSAITDSNKNQGTPSFVFESSLIGEIIYMGLKRPEEPALMEDYLFAYDQPGTGQDAQFLEDVSRNPNFYFNFNLNLDNYKSYMMKQIYMRMEKYVIKENMEKKGYDTKTEGQSQKPDYQFDNRNTEFQKGHHVHTEHKHVYNMKAPSYEAGQFDSVQIPHHLRMLFDNENKPLFEAKPQAHGNNMHPNTQTNFPSHSTLDSRRISEFEHPEGMRYSSFNTLLNQSNDFPGMKNAPIDLNSSSVSDRDKDVSLGNLSRNSGYLNSSNSKRNQSSRSNNMRAKNYQVTINEDIKLIERIETVLNAIIANHNKVCPFCNKLIDVKKSNFQNVSSFYSNSMRRYYLTHFDCYLKSGASHSPSKVLSLAGVTKAAINSQLTMLPIFDSTSFMRSDRRAYFLNIEGFHPLNTQTLFKLEKISYALEHIGNRSQLLFLNLENKSSCMFEPSSYMLPFNEFRLAVTVHMTHCNEDPYIYEFLVDLSSIKVTPEQKTKYAEAHFPPEGNGVTLGTQIVYDANTELTQNANYKVNLDSSFQSTASTASTKPDFGKNVFLILKQLSISLPLRRIEKRSQDTMVPILPESLFNTSQDSSTSARKKSHSKLHLNPNAPLFNVPNQVDQNPQAYKQQGSTQPAPNFVQEQNQNAFNNQNAFQNYNRPVNFNTNQSNFNQSNSLFNAPLFAQTFQPNDQGPGMNYAMPPHFQNYNFQGPNPHTQHQQPEHITLPPGLISLRENEEDHYAPPYMSQNVQTNQNQPPARNRGLHVDTKFQGYVHHVIEEANEEYQASGQNTPSIIPLNEGDAPALEKQKSKGLNNLYAAVLSGRKNDGSMPNSPCPSVTKLKNQYFSGFSTPGSERAQTPTTPKVNALSDQFEAEESGSVPMTEDMIENFRLEDHLGRLVEFAKTYNGSRLLQKFFPRANQHEVELVISEIQNHIEDLMLDPYANYMFQTLAQSCSADQRLHLLQEIAPSMVRVAADRKGTHSLQAIVSLVSRDIEEKLIRDALQGHIVELSFDSQGTHLIQKLIVAISPQNLGFVYQPLVERFLDVVNHSFGLCVLKVLMTKVDKIYEMKRPLLELLFSNFTNLIQNPYGNYALQHAMDVWPNDCAFLLEKAAEKIVQYSNQKFSSNVIEKCIIIAPLEIRKRYTSEIVKSERLSELMKNKYGNYVLLKLLSTLDNEGKQFLIQNISKHLNHVNVAKYRSRWTQFIDDNPFKIPGLNPSQTVKPSLFKSASLAENSPSQNKDFYEANSPSSAELWKDGQRKRTQRNEKEEKSQFYYGSGKTIGQRTFSGHMSGEDMEAYQSPGIKKGKNANQKFFSDKGQHHLNQGGHHNFH